MTPRKTGGNVGDSRRGAHVRMVASRASKRTVGAKSARYMERAGSQCGQCDL